MEITAQQIADAIKENPNLVTEVMPTLQENEIVKTYVENKANETFETKIGAKVKEIHDKYDETIFNVLGERPGQSEDGSKQKTYDFLTTKLTDLKGFNEKKELIDKDSVVLDLKGQIETLKKSGGGAFAEKLLKETQDEFTKAKENWQTKFDNQAKETENLRKGYVVKTALAGLKINEEMPESVRKLILGSAESDLMAASKFEGDTLVFLNPDGTVKKNNSTLAPMTAQEVLAGMEALKSIIKTDGGQKGGGAKPKVGKIEKKNVEGKDVERIELAAGSFKTQVEFIKIIEQSLQEAGVTVTDPRFTALKNKAFKEYDVAKLPMQ